MLVSWAVTVVVLDDLVEKLVELVVGVVGASIDADSRVLVGNTRENAKFEGNTLLALLVLVFIPDFLCQTIFASGVCSSLKEIVVVYEVLWSLVSSVESEF